MISVIRTHLKYLSYVVRHKWFVAVECFRRGLYWQGIMHDWSKFTLEEWSPYAYRFFGGNKDGESGYFHEPGVHEAFDAAWLHHIHLNPHHWQYHLLRKSDGSQKSLRMPDLLVEEMVCDWRGASKAQGKNGDSDVVSWYLENRAKMHLHAETMITIEILLGVEN